jgi:serpin B
LALGTGLILLHQLKGAEPAGAPGEPAGARGGVQKAASGPGAGTQPASAPAFDANDPDVKLLVKGLNEFAIDLYKEIAKTEKGNIFISPFSISCALSMTYAGARGETAQQMAKVLHFAPELTKDDGRRLHAAFGKLIAHLNAEKTRAGSPRGYDLITANGLWTQAGHPFLHGFIRTNTDHYGASVEALDFIGDRKGAAAKINAWVGKQTRGKIDRIVDESLLHDTTRLVLTNAAYFNGAWARKFDKALTREAVFHLPSGKGAKVPFMNRTGAAGFLTEEMCAAVLGSGVGCRIQELELPYVGREVSFLVLLPGEAQGIAALEKALCPGLLGFQLTEGVESIDISIPRLAMSFGIDLSPSLRGMGIEDGLSPGKADFSGMDSTTFASIGGASHMGRVVVNEEGTEAAAATGLMIDVRWATPPFVADHPFVFAIMHRLSGCILFIGRVMDPSNVE